MADPFFAALYERVRNERSRPHVEPIVHTGVRRRFQELTTAAPDEDGTAQPQKLRRRSFLVSDETRLQERCAAYKESVTRDDGTLPRGWVKKLTHKEFPATIHDFAAYSREICRIRRCIGRDAANSAAETHTRVDNGKLRTVKKRHLRRRGKPGRSELAPEVAAELFQWVVDTILFVKGRINAELLKMQAETIISDMRRYNQHLIDTGQAEKSTVAKLPTFDKDAAFNSWIYRFRKRHGLSWKMVNLRMKCSLREMIHRIRKFFGNLYKIRWLHFHLHGKRQCLRFEDCDEKPLWYTSASLSKTLNFTGRKAKTSVNECVPQTRKRFTMKTRTQWPKRRKDRRHAAILIKGSDDMNRNQKQHDLTCSEGFYLQFGPKGSYRNNSNVDFYRWLVQQSAGPDDDTLYISDWFKPNISNSELDDLIFGLGHGHMNLPGHVTGVLQVNDTHLHYILSVLYKRREIHDAMYQLQMGSPVPAFTDQEVINRAIAAYLDVDHDKICDGFVEVGIAADLFGSDDHKLTKEMKPFFVQCKLDELRKSIGDEIEARCESGELTHWHQFRKEGFLESYPKDPNMEGTEAFQWEIDHNADDDDDKDSASDCISNPDALAIDADGYDDTLDSLETMQTYLDKTQDVATSHLPTSAALSVISTPPVLDVSSAQQAVEKQPATPVVPETTHALQQSAPPPADFGDDVEGEAPAELASSDQMEAAKKTLFNPETQRALDAIKSSLATLRANGGDKTTEELLLSRVDSLENRKTAASSQGVKYVPVDGNSV